MIYNMKLCMDDVFDKACKKKWRADELHLPLNSIMSVVEDVAVYNNV